MSSSIVLPKNFNMASISFGAVKTLESGGKSIYISYNGSEFMMQSPKMLAPFGLSKWEEKGKVSNAKSSADKYSIEISFKDVETNANTKMFFDMLENIDNLVKKKAVENSLTYFNKKKLSDESAQDAYSSNIKHHIENGERSNKYPPRMRVAVPVDRDGNFMCKAYIGNEEVELTPAITKNCLVQCIIKCQSIWIIGGNKFGVTYKLQQIRLTPKVDFLNAFAFIELDDDKLVDDQESSEIEEESEEESSDSEDTPVITPVVTRKTA